VIIGWKFCQEIAPPSFVAKLFSNVEKSMLNVLLERVEV
jgi:hypothetical protein